MDKRAIAILFDDPIVVKIGQHALVVLLLGHNRFCLLNLRSHCVVFRYFSCDFLLLLLLSCSFVFDLLFAFSTLGGCFQQVTGSSFLYCKQKLICVVVGVRVDTTRNLQLIVVLALKILAISGSI
jgi:hypothetical protein